jgi:hypothetical protein
VIAMGGDLAWLSLQGQPCEACASQHVGYSTGGPTALIYSCDMLTKYEVLGTFVTASSRFPADVCIAHVPNTGNPFSGHFRYRHFTHGAFYALQCVRQSAALAGLGSGADSPSLPVTHGLVSAARWCYGKLSVSVFSTGLFSRPRLACCAVTSLSRT